MFASIYVSTVSIYFLLELNCHWGWWQQRFGQTHLFLIKLSPFLNVHELSKPPTTLHLKHNLTFLSYCVQRESWAGRIFYTAQQFSSLFLPPDLMIGGLPPVIEKSGTRALEQQAAKESTAPVTDPAKAPEERETNLPEGAQSSAALQSNNNGGCLKFVVSLQYCYSVLNLHIWHECSLTL